MKDITRSRSYQSRREGVYTFPHRISSLVGSGLCLGSQDLSMQDKMSELLVFEDVDMKENEGQWPVEVLVTVGEGPGGHLTVLDRDSYKEIASPMSVDSAKGEGPPGE